MSFSPLSLQARPDRGHGSVPDRLRSGGVRADQSDSLPYRSGRALRQARQHFCGVGGFKASEAKAKDGIAAFETSNVPAGSSLEARLGGQRGSVDVQAEGKRPEGQVIIVPNSMTRGGLLLACPLLLLLLSALGVPVAKQRRKLAEQSAPEPARKAIGSRVGSLLNSLADLDELFAAGKIVESKYRKERLESKAKLVAILKKSPPAVFQSHAARNMPR